MIDTIGNLVRYIVILLFVTVLFEMILPQGIFRRYLRTLVGILLIFTLMTPLQKIMHIAPLWDETAVFSESGTGNEDLAQIISAGEELQEENIRFALQDYRHGIFTLLEKELSEKFGAGLLQLDITLEENSSSDNFGSVRELSLLVRKDDKGRREKKERIQVETIRVKVHPPGPRDESLIQPGEQNENLSDRLKQEKEEAIRNHLASFLLLSPEQINVKLLP